MAYVKADGVAETCVGSGFGNMVLTGAVNGSYRPFAAVLQPGDTFPGVIHEFDGNTARLRFESGEFRFLAGGIIERYLQTESSNADGSPVAFGGGPKLVEIAAIAKARQEPPVGSGNYEHVQNSAATPWIVNHNLGYRPNVEITTLGGLRVEAEVLHTSVNQAQIFFDLPATGLALCS